MMMMEMLSICVFQLNSYQLHVVVQLLNHVQLFAIAWTIAHQASLSFTISWGLLKLMSFELVMPSNHLILCHPEYLKRGYYD